MKYSVSSYSYASMIRAGEITPFEVIAKTKELGFDAIEFVDFIDFLPIPEEERPAYAEKIKAEADRVGLEISCLTIGADFINGSDGDVEKEIERVKKFVDLGAILGVKRMRHDATVGYAWNSGNYVAFETLLPRLADACRTVTEYAEQFGIRTMIENHGFYAQDSDRVEKLHQAINHKNFGLLCDMGNFLCADENPALSFSRVAPYVAYVHAKDFIVKPFNEDPGMGAFQTRSGNWLRGTIVGHGNVPVKQCLHMIKKTGYDAYISIEFEGLEPVPVALKIGLDNLKRYWSQL
ncbi:MAG: sugar phosphate isomerase/epimerase [Clostridia bacterium]|nr:sugar phosphate isomerase/epimerase [Clostridia bacterium]